MNNQVPEDNLLKFIATNVESLGDQVESMRDEMATKSDIKGLEQRLQVETTAIRGELERVHLRLDTIERALSARLGQIETELSRPVSQRQT